MNKFQPARVLGVLGIAVSSLAFAQNYQTMPIASGLNADVIANGVGPSMTSTSTDVDGVSFAFISRDFQATSTSAALTYGLPINQTINSVVASTPGLSYILPNYSSNNSLKLSNQNDTGTITFATPKAAFKLYMLATTGSGSSTVNVVVNFTDNTSQTITNVAVADWYNNTGFAFQGFGRINRANDTLESGSGTNPRLYQSLLNIDAANQSKPIQSVTITKTSTAQGHANIFAFSADAYSDCAPPTLNTVGTLTSNTAAVSWTPAVGTTAATHDIYYSTTNTTPTSASAPNLTGITGNSTTIPGLNANTTYFYWVRANCSTATSQSAWSFSGTFKTLCGPVASMFENFDSYGTGNFVPDCWIRNYVSGTMSISSATPASGTRNIYQTSSSAQVPSTVVLPELSNINAGTHWLKLKARVNTATGTLNVGYVTNPTDASTFVLLQALSISNTNYTSTNPEYTVIVPSSVPANARLAVRNTADGKGYYWDDVVWESLPSCFPPTAIGTSAISSNSVTLSWTAPASAPANGYEYYYSTVNTAPVTATTPSGTVTAGNTTTVILGLSASTTYYVWMRSSCGANNTSVWYYVGVVNTLCGAVVPPYTNDFSTTPGNCWTNNLSGGSPTTPPTGTTAYWVSGAFLNTGSVNSMRINLYDTNRTGWLKTTPFDLTGGGFRVKFDYGLTAFNSTSSSTMGSDDNVQFLVSNDGGSTWTSLQTWNTSNTPSNTSTTYTYDLVGYNGANTVFAFYGTDGTVNDSPDYDFHVDNFVIENANLSTSETMAKNNAVKVYPNPFKDVINISEFKDIKTIKVTDLSGRTLKTIENPEAQINLGDLNGGLYLLNLQFKDGSQKTVKVIKK